MKTVSKTQLKNYNLCLIKKKLGLMATYMFQQVMFYINNINEKKKWD